MSVRRDQGLEPSRHSTLDALAAARQRAVEAQLSQDLRSFNHQSGLLDAPYSDI
jgi:hypothetical protein